MATVEIDEEELRRSTALRTTIANMLKHPRAKLLLEQAHKEVDPNANTPELDTIKLVHDGVSATREEIAALKKQLDDDKTERESASKIAQLNARVESGFAKLRQQGVTEAGIEGVKKLMEEEGLLNPEVAWSHFEKLHPPQAPVQQTTGGWDFLSMPAEGNDDLKQLLSTKGENDRIVDKMAFEALNQVRGQRAGR